MKYPKVDEVERADRVQLARWSRYLSPPGISAVGQADFYEVCDLETWILDRIQTRLEELGGMTVQISKKIDREK
jgi:hypothetical protein